MESEPSFSASTTRLLCFHCSLWRAK